MLYEPSTPFTVKTVRTAPARPAGPASVVPAAPLASAMQGRLSGPPGRSYLLLLSHMRSYSSLMAHLLGTSPEIDGYGESLLRYRSRLDLLRLRLRVRRATGQPLRGRWLLDKVLHNHIRPLYRWLPPGRVRALIFVRRPEPTLQSMLHLAHLQGDPVFQDAQRCCDYYVSRLHRLREDAERLGSAALHYDAEDLVQQPQALLDSVGDWLGLAQPLGLQYRVGSHSGKTGFGDPLPNIRSGQVLPASATTVRQRATLSPAILAEADAAYQRCRLALTALTAQAAQAAQPPKMAMTTTPAITAPWSAPCADMRLKASR